MLQLTTVDKNTLALLRSLAADQDLQHFSLAGGTALALRLGHRVSIDLDFFTSQSFDSNDLLEHLKSNNTVFSCSQTTNSLTLFIKIANQDIKVDFIRHNYPLLRPVQIIDQIRLFSLEDIAAMKLNAIANRGAKKDFFDIHTLLKSFNIKELLYFFEQKYDHLNSFTVIKSLVYFIDADMEPDPVSIANITWDNIKKEIVKCCQQIN